MLTLQCLHQDYSYQYLISEFYGIQCSDSLQSSITKVSAHNWAVDSGCLTDEQNCKLQNDFPKADFIDIDTCVSSTTITCDDIVLTDTTPALPSLCTNIQIQPISVD